MENLQHLKSRPSSKTVGPWRCEACGQISQYSEMTPDLNRIYCRNEACGFRRTVDKRRSRILENDGTVWAFDGAGNKWRVRS